MFYHHYSTCVCTCARHRSGTLRDSIAPLCLSPSIRRDHLHYVSRYPGIYSRDSSRPNLAIEVIAATSPGTKCCNRMAGQTSEHFPGSIGSKSPSSVTANPHAHDVCRNDCGNRVVISFRGCFPEIVPRIMFRGTAVSSITSTIRPQLKPQLPQFCDSGLGNRGIEDMGIEELKMVVSRN